MRIWLMWVAWACCSLCLGMESPSSKDAGPYHVTFQRIGQMDNIFSFRTIVSSGGHTVTLTTDWRAKDEVEALERLGRLTGEKDGVLFTPYSCAGGNAWRCELEVVVTNEPRLRVFGAVGRHVDWKKPGMSLKDGLFRDGFDGLEINPFTCHADAPSFEVLLERKGNHLVLAKEATWRMNEGPFSKYQQTMMSKADRQTITSAYLGALALTRICDRKKEWEATVRMGKDVLGRTDAERMVNYMGKTIAKYKWARMP